MNATKRLTLYVSSPDSYADVFDVFLRAFRKYWKDCPYEFVLTTNTNSYSNGIKCICNYKKGDTWTERTLAYLPQIESKYILLMCDDLIINRKVDNAQIEGVLDYMDNHKIRYCRLKPLPIGNAISEMPILNRVNKQMPYAVDLQMGIFKKDYLLELLGNGSLSAWDIENKINVEASKNKDESYEDIIGVNHAVISCVHGVYKGKWIHNAHSYIRKEYPNYQFSRPLLSFKYELKIMIVKNFNMLLSFRRRRKLKSLARILGFYFATKY